MLQSRHNSTTIWLRECVLALVYLTTALVMLRPALHKGGIPGTEKSEAWGRLFANRQVRRWLTESTPWGQADLLGWPETQPFWPIDPVVQIIQTPVSWVAGDAFGLTAVTILLLALSGWGPMALARTAGASVPGALIGGLLVQWSPYLLRNLHDMVLEVIAVGVLALAARQCLIAMHNPSRKQLIRCGCMVALLAGTSPYLALYLGIACGLAVPFFWRLWRSWAGLAIAGTIGSLLVLTPLVAVENGPSGRLSDRYSEHGYQLTPSPLVSLDENRSVKISPKKPPMPKASTEPAHGKPSRWRQVIHRLPGGLTVIVASVLALGVGAARRWGLAAIALFALGPGLPILLRQMGHRIQNTSGFLHQGIAFLPFGETLGNPGRLITVFLVCAGVAGALAASRHRLVALALAITATAELILGLPAIAIPSTTLPPAEHTAVAFAEIDGPTVFFPTGDPPTWHPQVAPKEVLYLAARAGVPVAFDYGRGQTPADLAGQLVLSRVSGQPVGQRALELGPEPSNEWPDIPFSYLVVLQDRLDSEAQNQLHAWLTTQASSIHQDDRFGVWKLNVIAQ